MNLAGGHIDKTQEAASLFPPAESFRENRPSAAGADVLDPATPGPRLADAAAEGTMTVMLSVDRQRGTFLGDDADTTGAVCGQLAGAYWGESDGGCCVGEVNNPVGNTPRSYA